VIPHPAVASVVRYEHAARELATVDTALSKAIASGASPVATKALWARRGELLQRLDAHHRDVLACFNP